MASSDKELEQQLVEAGNQLLTPPSSVDELLLLLDQIENFLTKVEQSPTQSMQNALAPSRKALVADELFKHSDADVKTAVACCISEITRITAPEAPYDDDQMKDVFQLIVSSFENLSDKSSRSYDKRTSILDTVAKVRSCVVMLDLECDALIVEMFQHFLSSIRDYHPDNVFASMETIMTLVLEESEDISAELLSPLLASVKKGNEDILPIARKLAEKVLEGCANKVKPYLQNAVKSLDVSLDDYRDIVASICQEMSCSVEQNVTLTADENKVEEKKPVEASPDEAAQADAAPKSVVSNGVAQTCEDESLADSCSLKKQDDSAPVDSSKNVDISTDADHKSLDAEKLVDEESNPDEARKKKDGKVNSSTKSAEPSESSNVDTEKDVQKPLDDKAASKVVPRSPHETDAEATVSSESKKEASTGRPSSPKALEGESVTVASPSESENLPKVARSKKKRSIKDCEPSVNDVSRKTSEGLSVSEAKQNKRPKKEISTKDSEPSADDVARKTSEEMSDSEVKLNKRSSKKSPAKIPNEEKTSKTNSSKKKTTVESETKSLKKPSKKADVNSNNGDGSPLTSAENKKLRNRGRSFSEKNVSEGSTKEDGKVSSPKSAAKSTKNVHQLQTPKTDNKRKRALGTEKGSDAQNNEADDWVGKKVKVYWPDDKKYYEGKINSYNASNKMHQILYDDGDEEILNLKEERWEFIQEDDDGKDEAEADEPKSPDAHPGSLPKKKLKASADQSAKHGKVGSVKGRGASSSKSKIASAKSTQKSKDSGKTDSKSMDDSKAVEETEDENVGNRKDNSNKSGSKSASKSSRMPKTSIEETKKTGKSKQDNPDVASNPKNKSSKSSSKSNGAEKLKSSSPKVNETVDDDSTDSDEPPESTKAKSKTPNSSKGQGSKTERKEAKKSLN